MEWIISGGVVSKRRMKWVRRRRARKLSWMRRRTTTETPQPGWSGGPHRDWTRGLDGDEFWCKAKDGGEQELAGEMRIFHLWSFSDVESKILKLKGFHWIDSSVTIGHVRNRAARTPSRSNTFDLSTTIIWLFSIWQELLLVGGQKIWFVLSARMELWGWGWQVRLFRSK